MAMTRIPTVPEKVDLKIVNSKSMRCVYFNRFKLQHTDDGLMLVRVWYQDALQRNFNGYAFNISDADFQSCKSNIKNYLQRVLQAVPLKKSSDSHSSETPPQDISTIETIRMISSSRVDNRAEIYLGYFPLSYLISTSRPENPDVVMHTALCSSLNCHVELLRQLVESK